MERMAEGRQPDTGGQRRRRCLTGQSFAPWTFRPSGCGSKLNRRGRPQGLVHVSTYQGSILEFRFFEPQPSGTGFIAGLSHSIASIPLQEFVPHSGANELGRGFPEQHVCNRVVGSVGYLWESLV